VQGVSEVTWKERRRWTRNWAQQVEVGSDHLGVGTEKTVAEMGPGDKRPGPIGCRLFYKCFGM
jgi:hypothetical protein